MSEVKATAPGTGRRSEFDVGDAVATFSFILIMTPKCTLRLMPRDLRLYLPNDVKK